MSIDFNSAMQMLENSFGENVTIFSIPSTNQQVSFKPLTVGMQKSISKMSLDYETDLDYQMLKLSVLKTLCLDDQINFDQLTEVDFIALLAQLRLNNFTEKLQLTIPCNNPKCNERFNHTVNIENILKKCEQYKFESYQVVNKHKVKDKEIEFKFILEESTIGRNIEYIQYIQYLNENRSQVIDINNTKLITYPIKFIKDVFIDGQQITKIYDNEQPVGFDRFSIGDKLEFIDQLPPPMYSEGNKNVLGQVLKHFPHTRLTDLFGTVKCPKCKQVREGVLTNDSFFII